MPRWALPATNGRELYAYKIMVGYINIVVYFDSDFVTLCWIAKQVCYWESAISWYQKSKVRGIDQESKQSSTTPDRDTIWESDKNTNNITHKSPFPAGDHKASWNRQDSITQTIMKHINKKDPQTGTIFTCLSNPVFSVFVWRTSG